MLPLPPPQLFDLSLALESPFGQSLFSTYHTGLLLHAARPCLGTRIPAGPDRPTAERPAKGEAGCVRAQLYPPDE